MPEGPEIRRMVDDIAQAVGRRTAERVFFAFDRYKNMEPALAGRRVTAVEARAKAVIVTFAGRGDDGPWCVYSHNQLYGQWRIGTADREPNTRRQLRFAIVGEQRAARLYSASDIRVLRPDELDAVPYLARLGPDPLNEDIDAARLLAQLDDRRFAGRALGGLLLDQGFVAGIGNYLRSEILFVAGLDPQRAPRSLDEHERRSLVDAIHTLIERAYRQRGITNDPERAARLKTDGVSFRARRHFVFGRAGKRCYACNATIEKQRVASRRLYRCPSCQR